MNIIKQKGFWAAILIISGVILLVNNLFDLDIPLFAILVSGFLIILGIYIMTNKSGFGKIEEENENTVLFGSASSDESEAIKSEYSVVFGSYNLDLSHLDPVHDINTIEVNVVLGSASVKLPPHCEYQVKMSSVFGTATAPDGSRVNFGDKSVTSAGFKENTDKRVYLRTNNVFGDIRVMRP